MPKAEAGFTTRSRNFHIVPLGMSAPALSSEMIDATLLLHEYAFSVIQSEIDGVSRAFASEYGSTSDDFFDRIEMLTGKQDAIATEMAELHARTTSSLVAKATVAREMLLRMYEDEIASGRISAEIGILWSLVADLINQRAALA